MWSRLVELHFCGKTNYNIFSNCLLCYPTAYSSPVLQNAFNGQFLNTFLWKLAPAHPHHFTQGGLVCHARS